MYLLREYLQEVLKEFWGEPSGGVVRDASTRQAQQDSPIPEDPFHLDHDSVYVPPDVRKKLKKYFRDMKMEPTDEPGKTYK